MEPAAGADDVSDCELDVDEREAELRLVDPTRDASRAGRGSARRPWRVTNKEAPDDRCSKHQP